MKFVIAFYSTFITLSIVLVIGEENEGKQRDDRKPTYNRYQSTEPDASQIIKTLAPLDGQQGVPFRNYNLPIIVKPNPIIIIGGAVGTIIIGGWILIGG